MVYVGGVKPLVGLAMSDVEGAAAHLGQIAGQVPVVGSRIPEQSEKEWRLMVALLRAFDHTQILRPSLV